MNPWEPDQHDTVCPRCGGEAQWSYTDGAKSRIGMSCEDCGRFEMSREEFDQAAVENAELTQPE